MSYNPVIIWMLYSPLHWILSGITMVISYTGRKSGKTYKVPIGYLRVGDRLLTVSFKRRKWWRSLRGGAEVILRLQGKDVSGWSEVIEDDQGVREGLRAYLEQDPRTARMLGVKLDASGSPLAEDLDRAAHERVIVRTALR